MAMLGSLVSMINDGSNKVQGVTTGMNQASSTSLNALTGQANQGMQTKVDPNLSNAPSQATAGIPGKAPGMSGDPATSMGSAAPAAGAYGFGDFMRDMFNKTPVGQAYNAATDNSNVIRQAQPVGNGPATGQAGMNPASTTTPVAPQQPAPNMWQNLTSMIGS